MTNIFVLVVILHIAGSVSNATDLLAKRNFCGYQHTDDYNRDNDEIKIDEFPWIAQLLHGSQKRIFCTGSLINLRYVLTAAFCLQESLSGVRLGDFNVTSDKDCEKHKTFGEACSDPVEDFEIEEKIPHPQYDDETSVNEIGLIRLSRHVTYSDYIRPICLPLSSMLQLKDGDKLFASGWGHLEYGGIQTDIKKKIITTVMSKEKCVKLYEDSGTSVNDHHFCAAESNAYTCQGDGGSPLIRSVNHQWEQVGILLYGIGCSEKYPIIYLNVGNYIDWIKQNLRK